MIQTLMLNIDILAPIGTVLGMTLLGRLISGLTMGWFKRWARRTDTKLDDEILATVKHRHIYYIFFFMGCRLAMIETEANIAATDTHVLLLIRALSHFSFIMMVLLAVALVLAILKGASRWYAVDAKNESENILSHSFLPLVTAIIKVGLWGTAIMTVLSYFGVDVKGLVVGMGIASAAIALSAQETLSNLVSGLSLLADQPFKVGDTITLEDGLMGTVQHIGLRSTRLLTLDNNILSVPNNEMARKRITTLAFPEPASRVLVNFSVAYGTPILKVKDLIQATAKTHPKVMETPTPRVLLLQLDESSMSYQLQAWFPHTEVSYLMAEELRVMVYNALTDNRIEIPFPQRVVHLVPPTDPTGANET